MAAVVGFTDFLCGSLCQWLVLQTDIMEEEWSRERNYEKNMKISYIMPNAV